MAQQKEYTNVNMNGQEINHLNAVYFGDPEVNGTWRMYVSDDTFLIERREFGIWVPKGSFHP